MATFAELAFAYRQALRIYPWRRIDPVPWTPLPRPLRDARVAVVTSAGLYRPGVDAPFARSPGGDVSFRILPTTVAMASLAVGQLSEAFDHAPIAADPNVALPLDRMRELAAAAEIGSLAPRAISFSGSILAPGRLVRDTGPAVAAVLRADAVDAALFVPV